MDERLQAASDMVVDKEAQMLAEATTKEEAEEVITRELDAYKATVDAQQTVLVDAAKQTVLDAIQYQVGLLETWCATEESAGRDVTFVRDRVSALKIGEGAKV